MKIVQKFSKEYLEQCKNLKPEEIVEFIENFQKMHGSPLPGKSKLISIKIPESLLSAFKLKASLHHVLYQTQIKRLMTEWLGS